MALAQDPPIELFYLTRFPPRGGDPAMPAKSRTLKAVTEADTAAPAPRKTVTKAAAEGSHLELLVAMRARVATAVEDPNTPARDLAALTRRLMEIAKDIEAIKLAEEQEGRGAEATPDDAWDASAI